MSATDEARTVATLRRLAAVSGPANAWVPDEAAVLRRGRRLRTRKVAVLAGAAAFVVALGLGVPATLTAQRATPPAGKTTSQEPRPVGDGRVAVLTDDIQAANVPAVSDAGTLFADGIAGWDLTVKPSSGWHPFATWQGVDVVFSYDTQYTGGGVSWRIDDDRPTSSAPDPGAGGEPPGDTYLVAGAVPAGLTDPVTLLSSTAGFDLGASGQAKTVELPTFHAPTDDGRLMYAVVLRGDAATTFAAADWQVTFVGSDGAVVIPGCEVPDACALELLPYAHLADAMLTRFHAPEATTAPAPTAASTPAPTAGPTPGGPANTEVPAETGPATNGTPTPLDLAAPGVQAAVGPIPGEGGLVTVGRFGDTLVRIGRDGADSDAMVGLSIIRAEGGMGGEPVTKEALGPWATVVYDPGDEFAGTDQERWFAFGTVPPDLPGVRAFVWSPVGFRLEDGTSTDLLELPMFTMPPMPDNPIEEDRPWFLVGFSGSAIDAVRATGSGAPFAGRVLFASADGTISDPACGSAGCSDAASQRVYDKVRTLLAAPPLVPTVS